MVIDHAWISYLLTLALGACMAWVVVSDAVRYIIPNTLNSLIILLFAVAVLLMHVPALPAVAAAALVLVVGLGLFALGVMGGGDIKLLTVLSLWTSWGVATLQFIFLTAIFGGLLVFVVLFLRFMLPPLWLKLAPTRNLPRLLMRGQPVPYGIAIAAAFSWLLATGGIAVLH